MKNNMPKRRYTGKPNSTINASTTLEGHLLKISPKCQRSAEVGEKNLFLICTDAGEK